MKKKLLPLLLGVLWISSCNKEYDLPDNIVQEPGPELSISQLRKKIKSANSLYTFNGGDTSLTLTITMDETSGNIYKQFYATDAMGSAIQLRVLNSGGLYQGDKIRLRLGRLSLLCSNSMIYLDSILAERDIVKLASGLPTLAKSVSMEQLLTGSSYQDPLNLQSQYVRISDVEFNYESRGKTLANAIARTSGEHKFGKCFGKTITLRTSGSSKFAGRIVPSGHGELSGLLQQYNDGYTLYLRDLADLQMNANPCGKPDTSVRTIYLYKDFEDKSLSSGGWTQVQSSGTLEWTNSNFAQSSYYARISNKVGESYLAGQTWYISPPIDLQQASQPELTFVTANSSTISPLNVLVSAEYVSGDPLAVNWQDYAYAQKSSFTFLQAGPINLNSWKGKTIRIAYRYTALTGSGSIWNLDNIQVRD